jgi:DNA polymerase V
MRVIKVPKIGNEIEVLPYETNENLYAQYFGEVPAGFPSPAADFEGKRLSLDERYIQHPECTYLVRVKGDSMNPTLQKGDLLIVKSDLEMTNNSIAVLSINNAEFTVKRFNKRKKMFVADNEAFPAIEIQEDDIIQCLGVVKHFLRDIK